MWGSSGCDTNIPPYFVFRDSSDIQIDSVTFFNINSGYMSPNNQYDWGTFNAITGAGDTAGWLHTLTNAQWGYLINQRYDAEKKRGVAEIEGTKGEYAFHLFCSLGEGFFGEGEQCDGTEQTGFDAFFACQLYGFHRYTRG